MHLQVYTRQQLVAVTKYWVIAILIITPGSWWLFVLTTPTLFYSLSNAIVHSFLFFALRISNIKFIANKVFFWYLCVHHEIVIKHWLRYSWAKNLTPNKKGRLSELAEARRICALRAPHEMEGVGQMKKPEKKECLSLSLCRKTFKLKGNKKFRTWTKKS